MPISLFGYGLEKERVEVKGYWSPFNLKKEEKNLPEREVEYRMLEPLRHSVKQRLISDVPLGIFLSGGIDSSAITVFPQEEVPGKVKTFSIGFEDPSFDESKYASMVSEFLGTEHFEQRMTSKDLLDIVPYLLIFSLNSLANM